MLVEVAAELGGRVKRFRQNRDVRFSADKSPYAGCAYHMLAPISSTASAPR